MPRSLPAELAVTERVAPDALVTVLPSITSARPPIRMPPAMRSLLVPLTLAWTRMLSVLVTALPETEPEA